MPEFHPVANLFPLIEGSQFVKLVEDIRRHGLLEPIWLYEDQIIDGRNRYRACIEAGVTPEYRTWSDEGSLVEFVISLNLHRRHLTASQRAAIAVEALSWLEQEARERKVAAGRRYGERHPKQEVSSKVNEPLAPTEKSRAVDEAAALMGVSGTYVAYGKRLSKEAPDELALVREGKQSMKEAMEKVPPVQARRKPRPRKPSTAEQIMADYTAAWADLVAARPTLSPDARFMKAWTAFAELSARLIESTRRLDEYQRSRHIRDMKRRREARP